MANVFSKHVLRGRSRECETLDRALEDARARRSRVEPRLFVTLEA
jgi:hypothetical protein